MTGEYYPGTAKGRARVISIISGKGGVGKTTLVSNLGTALAENFGKRVLAVDANITTANLAIHMGLRNMPTTLHDVLENKIPVTNAIYESCGMDVIPATHSLGDERLLESLHQKIMPILPNYDFVLLDSSPGLGMEARFALGTADELLLIANPELSAVIELLKMIELAKKKGIPVIGIVLNRVTGADYEFMPSEIELSGGVNVISVVPDDRTVPKSTSTMTPAVIYNPKSPASMAFKSLAARLVYGKEMDYATPIERLARLVKAVVLSIKDGGSGMFKRREPKRLLVSVEGANKAVEKPHAKIETVTSVLDLYKNEIKENKTSQTPK